MTDTAMRRGVIGRERRTHVGSMAMFEPDILLPVQMARETERQPERKLMLAVIEDALDILVKGRACDIRDRHEAHVWLFSDDTSRLYSAQTVCDILGFDIGFFRREVTRREDLGEAKLREEKLERLGVWARIVHATRTAYGWTLSEFARRVGAHESSPHNWERGDWEPDTKFRGRILALHAKRPVKAEAVTA